MLSVSEAVETIIKNRPFLEEALLKDLVNTSALARDLKIEVAEITQKHVGEPAINMAIRRFATRIQSSSISLFSTTVIKDLTVRMHLAEYTYKNTDSLEGKLHQLMGYVEGKKDVFCNQSRGVHETTIIVSEEMEIMIKQIFSHETLLSNNNSLSSITIKLKSNYVDIPGVYYAILKKLAWENINVCEFTSTSTELTLYFHDKDVNTAFAILNRSDEFRQNVTE